MLRAGTLGVMGAGLGYGVGLEPRWLEVRHHVVPVPRLPSGLEGFTVAQLTDVHLSTIGHLHESIFEAIHLHRPQLVVLTGDIIDASERLKSLADLCAGLAGDGRAVIATLGNWEHWGRVPIDLLRTTYEGAGARLMINERSTLAPQLELAATDDLIGGRPDLAAVLTSLPTGGLRILLTHAPAILDGAIDDVPRFDLVLAGHTHGGQIQAWDSAPFVPPGSGRFVAGMYETSFGEAYVSRGIGTSILPVRMMCRPELPFFRFVRA